MSNQKYFCPKCREPFTRERNIAQHLKKNTESCRDISARLEAHAEEVKQKTSAELNKQLNIIQENNKKVVDNLILARPVHKERKQVVENIQAQGKVLNFEKVVRKTKIPENILRTTVELMSAGDIILFRRIFIDHVDPQLRCIRVKDFGRDKYEYFDGNVWVTTTLGCIVEMFANELHDKYIFLIMEKAKKVAEIDRKYRHVDHAELIAKEIDELCIEYANITEHVTKLGIQEPEFMNEIKRGIRGFLAQSIGNGQKKSKTHSDSAFEYNEESEEIESISVDSEEINEVFLEEHEHIPVLRMMGIHIDL